MSREEQVRYDAGLGEKLAALLSDRIRVVENVDAAVYLRKLAVRLRDEAPEPAESPLGVFLMRAINGKWRNASVPGARIYLSLPLLREVEFENELAAAIAIQLAHLKGRHVLNRAEKPLESGDASPDLFGQGGIFSFEAGKTEEAIAEAVGILYGAGYDPRGVVSLWDKHLQSPEHSPYTETELKRFKTAAHRAIAGFAPLRNPIVRTKDFLRFKRRIGGS